jgi:hypothetical protein
MCCQSTILTFEKKLVARKDACRGFPEFSINTRKAERRGLLIRTEVDDRTSLAKYRGNAFFA